REFTWRGTGAGQGGAVGKDGVVADAAVMAHVRTRHEEVVAADARRPGMGRAAVNGDVFPKDVVVANLQTGRFPVVLEVLGPFAEHGTAVNAVVTPHCQRSAQGRPRPDDAARSDPLGPFDDGERADLDLVGYLRFG